MDADVAIFDNADTKKEGASFTYNNRFGFAPIFAHLGSAAQGPGMRFSEVC